MTPTTRTKRPTQADVARLAAVSQPVVSYVLRGDASIPVAAETRRRVIAAIDELGYVPDRAARSLRTRRTLTIAAIIPDITNPFYPAFVRGIQDAADVAGYDLLVTNTDGDAEKEGRVLRLLHGGRVDGVVAVFFHLTAHDLRPLLERQVAIVRLEAGPKANGPLPLDNLYVDNAAAARDAVVYLIEHGHRRIGLIGGRDGPRHPRYLGYRRALTEHGLVADRRLIRETDFRQGGGYDAMREMLALPSPPSAVFAVNDLLAVGALLAARDAGTRVPTDVAVVGFDDIPLASLVTPALTTVAQYPERLGARAAALLFERLSGAAKSGGRSERMPYQLVARASA